MAGAGGRSWLRVAARLLLGAVFVYAAVGKIGDPPAFAKEVFGYKLLPGEAVNLLAIYLPWLELLVGLALVVGLWSRAAAGLAGAMLVMFIGAIGIRFARGETDFECGCFPHEGGGIGIPVLEQVVAFLFTSTSPWVTLARDVVFLGLAAIVIRKPRPADAGSAEPLRAAGRSAG